MPVLADTGEASVYAWDLICCNRLAMGFVMATGIKSQ